MPAMRPTPYVIVAMLAGTAGWLGSARAQGDAADTELVSFADAQREAADRAPDVIRAATRIDVARADVGVAGNVGPNPRVTLGTTTHGSRFVGSFYAFLPFFGRRQASQHAAEAMVDVVSEDVEVARLDAQLAAAMAWIDLWLAEREAAVAGETSARRERLAHTADAELEVGGVSRLDALRARAEFARASAEASASGELRTAAAARLARWLGREPTGATLATRGDLPATVALPSHEEIALALAEHPISVRMGATTRASEAAVRWQRRELWPIFGVTFGANLAARNGSPNEYTGAVLLDLPAFTGPQRRRAEALQVAADADADAAVVSLTVGAAEARARLSAAIVRAHAARVDVLPVAREAAELASQAYSAGDLDLTTTLAAEQALLDASLAAERADAEQARAVAALHHALGRFP